MQHQSVLDAAGDVSTNALHGAAISRIRVLMPSRLFLLHGAERHVTTTSTGTVLSSPRSKSCELQATHQLQQPQIALKVYSLPVCDAAKLQQDSTTAAARDMVSGLFL